jgi:hypothetical protein
MSSSIALAVRLQSSPVLSELQLTLLAEDLQNEGIIERSSSPEGSETMQETEVKVEERQRSATIILSSDEEEGDVSFVSTKRVRIVDEDVIDLTED